MKYLGLGAALLTATSTMALAGGIDRSGQSVNVIFEDGRYMELSLGSVDPTVSGQAIAFAAPGLNSAESGDMAPSYMQVSGAYKADLNDTLSYALIFDQPFGADVAYPASLYYAQGATAQLRSYALTGLLKYTNENNFSAFGGLRLQSMEATASVPFVSNYEVEGERDYGAGFVAGVAYEVPEIALRVGLTYNSSIDHSVRTVETSDGLGAGNVSTTDISTPQSLNLDFQSGIAENTLLFGSVRWVEWSSFDISPADYGTLTSGGSLVSYDDDTITYSLGVGRRINENWAVAGTVGYEAAGGGFASNLGPTDGNTSYGLGATYTKDNMEVTFGVRYVEIGDAQTQLGPFSPSANFTDNTALAAGVKVAYTF